MSLTSAAIIISQLTLFLCFITFFPGLPPDIKFESFSVQFRPLEGALRLNDKLDGAEKLLENEIKGPEHLEVYNNELYTSTHGGYIQKVTKRGQLLPVVKFGEYCEGLWQEHICGRPLGLKIQPNGIMHAADAYYGIKQVNLTSGDVTSLVDIKKPIEGVKPMIPNSLDVSKSGVVYWTDSSTSHKLNDGLFTLLGNGNGRLLMYDPKKKVNTVLMKNLHFPNGIMLSDDESFVVVAETFNARLVRYHLTGKNAGKSDIFLDNLPGFPDNINKHTDGKFLVSILLPGNMLYERITTLPNFRKFLARIGSLSQIFVKSINNFYHHQMFERIIHWIGHFEMVNMPFLSPPVSALIVDKNGVIVDSLHGTDGSVSHMSSLTSFQGYYYLGSPYNPYLARVKIR